MSTATPGSAGQYFRDIYDAVRGVLIGMKITLRYVFIKPVTVNYPEQRLTFSPRYRGIHEFELNKCIACDLCRKACPVDCIYIEKTAPRRIDKNTGLVDESDPKNGKMIRFAIDYSKCLFCALCTEPCPTDCIHMGKLHDLSAYSRQDAVVEFAELDKQGLHTPIPLWMERNKDKIDWVGQEHARVTAGKLAGNGGDIPKV
ncbi:MAG: NADH-quinone oxidoreductase subunit I [Tepidisphaeraceae bacterium]